jgi:hypothetical protein
MLAADPVEEAREPAAAPAIEVVVRRRGCVWQNVGFFRNALQAG